MSNKRKHQGRRVPPRRDDQQAKATGCTIGTEQEFRAALTACLEESVVIRTTTILPVTPPWAEHSQPQPVPVLLVEARPDITQVFQFLEAQGLDSNAHTEWAVFPPYIDGQRPYFMSRHTWKSDLSMTLMFDLYQHSNALHALARSGVVFVTPDMIDTIMLQIDTQGPRTALAFHYLYEPIHRMIGGVA